MNGTDLVLDLKLSEGGFIRRPDPAIQGPVAWIFVLGTSYTKS